MRVLCKVICICNQKGGVAKTTSTVNLGVGLAKEGKRVLLIDMDPQGSLTASLGFVEPDDIGITLASVMMEIINEEDLKPKEGILHHMEDVDLLPANIELSALEITMGTVMSREVILKEYIEMMRAYYDYILIDCPPSLNTLTVNAMVASSTVLVPIQCEYYALEGISQLIHTIDLVQQRLNSKLQIDGVVFTMYDARTNLSSDVVDTVKNNLNATVYQTIIPRNVRLAEAPSHGLPINLYDPKSTGAESYRNLAKEIIGRKDI